MSFVETGLPLVSTFSKCPSILKSWKYTIRVNTAHKNERVLETGSIRNVLEWTFPTICAHGHYELNCALTTYSSSSLVPLYTLQSALGRHIANKVFPTAMRLVPQKWTIIEEDCKMKFSFHIILNKDKYSSFMEKFEMLWLAIVANILTNGFPSHFSRSFDNRLQAEVEWIPRILHSQKRLAVCFLPLRLWQVCLLLNYVETEYVCRR